MIIKFCKTIHRNLALKQGKIRIGTINLYKTIENDILKDEEEGIAKYTYIGKKFLTEDDNDKLFAHIPYKLANGWQIDTNGCAFHMEPPQFNTFIFSCSQIEKDELREKAKHLNYEDYYEIINLEKFAFVIAKKLSIKYNNLNVKYKHGLVAYIDKKATIISEEEKDTIKPLQFRHEDFFEKPNRFSNDKEYRFVWLIPDKIDSHTFQSILDDYIDIKVKKITKFISYIN